jgi:hypothetical protein
MAARLGVPRQTLTFGNASTPRVPGRARYTPPPPLSRQLKASVRRTVPPQSKLQRKERGRRSLIIRSTRANSATNAGTIVGRWNPGKLQQQALASHLLCLHGGRAARHSFAGWRPYWNPDLDSAHRWSRGETWLRSETGQNFCLALAPVGHHHACHLGDLSHLPSLPRPREAKGA